MGESGASDAVRSDGTLGSRSPNATEEQTRKAAPAAASRSPPTSSRVTLRRSPLWVDEGQDEERDGDVPYLGTSSVVVALHFDRPRSRANLRAPGVWYFSR